MSLISSSCSKSPAQTFFKKHFQKLLQLKKKENSLEGLTDTVH